MHAGKVFECGGLDWSRANLGFGVGGLEPHHSLMSGRGGWSWEDNQLGFRHEFVSVELGFHGFFVDKRYDSAIRVVSSVGGVDVENRVSRGGGREGEKVKDTCFA